jgi:hypothetical protein
VSGSAGRSTTCADHVLRQRRAQGLTQLLCELAAFCRSDHVRHQPLVASDILARDDGDVAHLRVLRDRRLDLAELDAEAADLHLVVDAAEVLDVAVVAGAARGRRCDTHAH